MEEMLHRVPRHLPTAVEPSKKPSWLSVNRNAVTLVLSIAAFSISIIAAGTNLWTFYHGTQQKTLNEADQILLRAEANRVLQEVNANPSSHPRLRDELAKLYKDLLYQPPFDAPLTVNERMAFALAVEVYATPMTNVQLQVIQARAHAADATQDDVAIRERTRCFIQPYAFGCPPSVTDKK